MKGKLTEATSNYSGLEEMDIRSILLNMNQEDHLVPEAISREIPAIEKMVQAITDKMLAGGRLFYIGAGTSGRLGILDASECPPTFGVSPDLVIGIIAGGKEALTSAVEFAEDDPQQGWKDLLAYHISTSDFVIGLSASGSTPYVVNSLKECKSHSITTGSISCNISADISQLAVFPVEIPVGPEFITASTRLKCGTAQKLVLNMISTAVMIKLGRVKDNKMVNMQLTNEKLVDRGVRMVMEALNWMSYDEAKELLLKHGSVKKAVEKTIHK